MKNFIVCLFVLFSVPIVLPNGNVLIPAPNVPVPQPDPLIFPQNPPEFRGNYVDPMEGRVYVPIAPNVVIDVETGKIYP